MFRVNVFQIALAYIVLSNGIGVQYVSLYTNSTLMWFRVQWTANTGCVYILHCAQVIKIKRVSLSASFNTPSNFEVREVQLEIETQLMSRCLRINLKFGLVNNYLVDFRRSSTNLRHYFSMFVAKTLQLQTKYYLQLG